MLNCSMDRNCFVSSLLMLVLIVVTIASPVPNLDIKDVDSLTHGNKLDSEVNELEKLKVESNTPKHESDSGPSSQSIHRDSVMFDSTDGTKHLKEHETVLADGETLKEVTSTLDEEKIKEGESSNIHSHLKIHVDVPKDGLHDTYTNDDGVVALTHDDQKRSESYPQVRYTPLDLALYIYRTGDEESVSLAIQELIAAHLMTTDEALGYLQEIRKNLRYIDDQDDKIEHELEMSNELPKKHHSYNSKLNEANGDYDSEQSRDIQDDGPTRDIQNDGGISELYMNDIIYNMARVLFRHAIARGGEVGSEKAVQELSEILAKEVEKGNIPQHVQKKVLEVIVWSLMDSIRESELDDESGPVVGGFNSKLLHEDKHPTLTMSRIGQPEFKLANEKRLKSLKSMAQQEESPHNIGDFLTNFPKTTMKRGNPEKTG